MLMKDMNNKTVANTLNDERLTAFPLRLGTGFRCPLSPLLFNSILEVLARQCGKKRNKGIQIVKQRKEEAKLSLFTDDITIFKEKPKESIKKLRESIIEFSNLTGYKVNI